jgi:hypothetical protein
MTINRVNFALWGIGTLLMLSAISVIAATQQSVYAQPQQGQGRGPCPDGYEFNKGICQAEPTIGCGSATPIQYEGADLCIIGTYLSSMIPFPDPDDPCGTAEITDGTVYIYPHPLAPPHVTNTCAAAFAIGQMCPGEVYTIHHDGVNPPTSISTTINPETGMCELKPGPEPEEDPACPENAFFFEAQCHYQPVPDCSMYPNAVYNGPECVDIDDRRIILGMPVITCANGGEFDEFGNCVSRPGGGRSR